MTKKLTVENIIENKIHLNRLEVVEFDSKVLGGVIDIKRIAKSKFQGIISKLDDKLSDAENEQIENKLIYECIPILHNKKLQDEYEVKAPYDIVSIVFDENIVELNKIQSIIYNFYGIDIEALAKAKK